MSWGTIQSLQANEDDPDLGGILFQRHPHIYTLKHTDLSHVPILKILFIIYILKVFTDVKFDLQQIYTIQ